MELDNIKPLDGIRTIAITLVLIWHYITPRFTEYPIIIRASWWSWSGVDLFFVLSGFLIGRILLYNKGSKNYFKTFYVRRILRIFPAYYLVLGIFIILLINGLFTTLPDFKINSIPIYSYIFYIQNFWMAHYNTFGTKWLGVTWSLAIEEQFYLLLPLLIFISEPKLLPKFLIIGILLAPICRALFSTGLSSYVILPARMDSLLMGVLIAFYHLNGNIERVFKKRRKVLIFFLIFCFILLYITKNGKSLSGTGGVYIHSILMGLYGTVLVLVLVLGKKTFLIRFLSTSVMSFFARISYMIYLVHQPVIELLQHVVSNVSILISLSLIITITFSSLSYFIIEKPILAFGKMHKY